MSYDLFGYNPYGMNMANSLYMMNFYDQLKNYYAGGFSKTTDGAGSTAAGSGKANVTSVDFQTAFQDAFRKALQESMGIAESTADARQTASGTAKAAAKTASGRRVSAQSAYAAMGGYGSRPSHIWTSSLARS